MSLSLADILRANGPFFSIVFLSLSLSAVALIIYRWLRNMFLKTKGLEDFINLVVDEVDQRGNDSAKRVCEQDQRVFAPIFWTTLDYAERNKGKVAARDAIASQIQQEILPSLNQSLPWISFIVKVAPMAGLLGTVSGMISAFRDISQAGAKVDPSQLADSIGMALFTTFEGLVIGILVLGFYTYFRQRLLVYEVELQRAAQAALELLPIMQSKIPQSRT